MYVLYTKVYVLSTFNWRKIGHYNINNNNTKKNENVDISGDTLTLGFIVIFYTTLTALLKTNENTKKVDVGIQLSKQTFVGVGDKWTTGFKQ